MKLSLRPLKLPRLARLHPSGVSYEAALPFDPPSCQAVRVQGGAAPAGITRAFKFHQGITAKS